MTDPTKHPLTSVRLADREPALQPDPLNETRILGNERPGTCSAACTIDNCPARCCRAVDHDGRCDCYGAHHDRHEAQR